MTQAHKELVEAQFGPRAAAYVESAVHAQGEDLAALEAVVAAIRPERALDLGAGGGHVSYLMARHAGSVTAARTNGLPRVKAMPSAGLLLLLPDWARL